MPVSTYTRRYQHASDDNIGPEINTVRLRSMLYEVGMTQDEFAEACHVTKRVLSYIITGRRAPTLRMRYRIAYVVHKLNLDPKGEIISGNDGFVDYSVDTRAIEAFTTTEPVYASR